MLCGRVRWQPVILIRSSNTVTAIYSTRREHSDTATASASTNLFQPSVDVTKNCTPDPVVVGGVVTCTIVVTNTSSDDTPVLINGTIDDTLAGNLLDRREHRGGLQQLHREPCPAVGRARSSQSARCWRPIPTRSSTR